MAAVAVPAARAGVAAGAEEEWESLPAALPGGQAAAEGWAVPDLQVGAAVREELAALEAVRLNCKRWGGSPSREIS